MATAGVRSTYVELPEAHQRILLLVRSLRSAGIRPRRLSLLKNLYVSNLVILHEGEEHSRTYVPATVLGALSQRCVLAAIDEVISGIANIGATR